MRIECWLGRGLSWLIRWGSSGQHYHKEVFHR